MQQIEMIDLNKIEPNQKHDTFSTNEIETNDLQKETEVSKVEVRKNNAGSYEETLGEIASKDLRKAEVFKTFGLDFCCGGKKSLKDACFEKGLDYNLVTSELDNAEQKLFKGTNHNFNSWNLSFLSEYIINVHHDYARQNIPMLINLISKVQEHHGKIHPELQQINSKMNMLFIELKEHMIKEENILFPFIKQLELNKTSDQINFTKFKVLPNTITRLIDDHTVVGDLIKQIRNLTLNYTLPSTACSSYALLYKKLEEFEDDLHIHIHLENNILFPSAIKMQTS